MRPASLSAMCIWMPFVSTVRCFISLTVLLGDRVEFNDI
jgi:hypothetical protein